MNKKNIAISVQGVSKKFLLPHQKNGSIKNFFLNPFSRYDNTQQDALKDISFEVNQGDFFGIVGRNGSGKSTLLKCIAGVYSVDKGRVSTNGSLIPFIELGVGFNQDLSGRDNVYLNGALLGFSRSQIDSMYDEIVNFAELEEFMDQKLKNYSSGMQVRLAFSIAVRADGDILLLDEVLAVGDTEFQQKCFSYFENIRQKNKTVVLVSHDMNALRKFCKNGVLIEKGKIISRGPIDVVLDDYSDSIRKKSGNSKRSLAVTDGIIGSGKVKIIKAEFPRKKSQKHIKFTDEDKNINLVVNYQANQDIISPVYGVTIKDNIGTAVFSSNTLRREVATKSMSKDDIHVASWEIPNLFNSADYTVSLAATDKDGKEIFHRLDNHLKFSVEKKKSSTALTNPDHKVTVIKK